MRGNMGTGISWHRLSWPNSLNNEARQGSSRDSGRDLFLVSLLLFNCISVVEKNILTKSNIEEERVYLTYSLRSPS